MTLLTSNGLLFDILRLGLFAFGDDTFHTFRHDNRRLCIERREGEGAGGGGGRRRVDDGYSLGDEVRKAEALAAGECNGAGITFCRLFIERLHATPHLEHIATRDIYVYENHDAS